MKIIGCDFHPSYQQIAMVDTETGELWERRLEHEQGEARRFYQALQGQPVRVGMEAVGNTQWFERMLAALGQEL
jgi:transposase